MNSANKKIDEFRKEINNINIQMIKFSLFGETILEWNDKDIEHYHAQRMAMDSMLVRETLGIVSGGDGIEVLSRCFLEGSEFDERVAERVRIRCESEAETADDIVRDAVAICLTQVHHGEWQVIASCRQAREFNVFFSRAVRRFPGLHDSDVEQMRTNAATHQQMACHGTVHSSGNKQSSCHWSE